MLDFGWPDTLAPPLERLCNICKSIDSWLNTHVKNVVVLHCKGGLSRLGVVIAAYIDYCNVLTRYHPVTYFLCCLWSVYLIWPVNLMSSCCVSSWLSDLVHNSANIRSSFRTLKGFFNQPTYDLRTILLRCCDVLVPWWHSSKSSTTDSDWRRTFSRAVSNLR